MRKIKFIDRLKKHLNSTIFRITAIVIAAVLPINIVSIVLAVTVISQSQNEKDSLMQATLDSSAESLSADLTNAMRRLTYLSINNQDVIEYSVMDETTASVDKSSRITSIMDLLQEVSIEYSVTDIVFLQFPSTGTTISSGSASVSRDIYLEHVAQLTEDLGKYGSQWTLFTDSEKLFLLGVGSWNGIYYGVLLNTNKTTASLYLPDYEGEEIVFFSDTDLSVFSKTGNDFLESTGYSFSQLQASSSFNVYISEVENAGINLITVVENDNVWQSLPYFLRILEIVTAFLTILAIPLLLYYVRRWLSVPLRKLTQAMHLVEEGDLDYRIPEESTSREFDLINHSFNTMLDQVETLKIDVYEKELEKQNITMEYLSHQVQPHFILNVMNILYSYEPEEYELSQKMILCISKYFRYIVKVNAPFVTLQQELSHIENYFEIQEERYRGMFQSIVEYEEGLRRVLVPPLLIQNFVENSIKYSLQAGKKIYIFVIGDYFKPEEEGDLMMRIRIADTGKGISDELLDEVELFKETGKPQPHLGVGIQNSISRLKYMYNGMGSIRLYKEENVQGTTTEIILPIYFDESEIKS